MLASLGIINSVISSGEFSNFISTLQVPWYIPTIIASISLITFVAHGRREDA